MSLTKPERRQRIRFRIRKSISGTATNPRLSVFRSNKEIYAQLIDDVNGVTVGCFFKRKEIGKGTNVDVALQLEN
jgi:large subunit ribosomal protein L18